MDSLPCVDSGDQVEKTNPTTGSRQSGIDLNSSAESVEPASTDEVKLKPAKVKKSKELWKRTVRKSLRMHGEQYISCKGTQVEAKRAKLVDCRCRYKCTYKVSHETQSSISRSFWGLGDYNRQKDFICSTVHDSVLSYGKKKKKSRKYHFKPERVCKAFFLKTLDVTKNVVETALKDKDPITGSFASIDKRGKHTPHNKTEEDLLKDVREHIESFPVMESHYCRKSTSRSYLSSTLNLSIMYRLYLEKMSLLAKETVSEYIYRNIFNTDYNLSFHVPKKDTCPTCEKYDYVRKSGSVGPDLGKEYEEHQRRKDNARRAKKLINH